MSDSKELILKLSSRQLMAIRSSARGTIDRNAATIERYKTQAGVEGIVGALSEESADLLRVIQMTDEMAFKY